jgi:hypothetical protein
MSGRLLGWRAFYDGGRVFDSRETEWKDMPYDGVQVIVAYLERGERIISGHDYYFKLGNLIGGNSDSLSTIRKRYPGASVKRGRWVSDEDHNRFEQEARKAR